jgi:hypothetical protein
MDARREELKRLLDRRRRRGRLMLVCLVTALACGVVAGIAAPQMLIGGMFQVGADRATAGDARQASAAVGPLGLSEHIRIDPLEAQADASRWSLLTEDQRRAIFDRYWQLAEMEPAQRKTVFERYAAFRDLPEKRQEFLRDRARKLKEFMGTLSPQDQAVLESMGETERAQRLLELWRARYGTW